LASVFDRRFVVVTGKGGVGKTTVAAALAVAASRRGLRVLVAMCDAKERLSSLLGCQAIGSDIVPAAGSIEAVNMVPERCLEEYGAMVLRVRAIYRAVFENRTVRGFLQAVPGLHEWAMLGKAWYHTTELRSGRPRYDLVILDAPATGHGAELLRVPKVIVDVAPPGLLRREAEKAWSLMQDPDRCEVLLVTVPEELPVSETIDLHAALAGEMGLPMRRVVVNAVLPPIWNAGEEEAILAARPAAEVASLVQSARSRIVRTRLQLAQLTRLESSLPLSQVRLPFAYGAEFGRDAVELLAQGGVTRWGSE
jgi:anion-transporting  ArsA/GET3 family ATPase